MARINPSLLQRLQKELDLSRPRVYALIADKVRETNLSRPLAAIALAGEHDINIAKYAKEDDLAELRQAARNAAPPPVIVPKPTERVATGRPSRRRQSDQRRRGTSVFVVHGRNETLAKELFIFLRAIGLQPIEWVQAIGKTKQASPYVGTILERAFSEAAAVVVLLTPDDEARLRKPFLKKTDPAHERRLTGQARPNVLFEAGMAMGRNPASTILVQVGNLRPFSDVAGRHLVHLSNEPTSRRELATKLANAGCNVDTSGTDWLTAGDLSL